MCRTLFCCLLVCGWVGATRVPPARLLVGWLVTHDRRCAPQSWIMAYTCASGTSSPDAGGCRCRIIALRATRWLSGVAVWWRIAALRAVCWLGGYAMLCGGAFE